MLTTLMKQRRYRIIQLLLTVLLLCLTSCSKKVEPVSDKITYVETTEAQQGGFVTSLMLQGHQIYLYQPEDIMHADIINYGYSAPLLMVFSDQKTEKEEAVRFICEKGIDQIAQQNGGFVLYVNPVDRWEKEDDGIYETILAKTAVAQSGFSHGLLHDGRQNEYFFFASPALTCLYGYGHGADYIARNDLKETKGVSSMSSLGSDDITITAAVLEGLSTEPVIADRDIIIISKGNDKNIDETAQKQSDHYHCDDSAFPKIYEKYISGYQRWNGKLSETVSLEKLGLVMDPLVFRIDTSFDNSAVRSSWYKAGVVVWHKKEELTEKKPLLLCFHGGGDTAITTASIAGWPQIAAENDFILCAIEMHTHMTASETIEVINQLKEAYPIDETRIYATGFSMGGIKTWDLYQEYPEVFAALAPMGATVDVGRNTQFMTAPSLNEEIMVPLFCAGGEASQLQELPFQGKTCVDRINYLFDVNGVQKKQELTYFNRAEWPDTICGYEGDIVEQYTDDSYPDSVTTIRYYRSLDGNIYTALCSISHHQHEIRPFTCQKAWEFMQKFSRSEDGRIVINE